MKVIYKYPVPVQDQFKLGLPAGAKVLDVQTQGAHGGGQVFLWALIDKSRPREQRHFVIKGTGHEFEMEIGIELEHVGTFQLQDGRLVFHVFEAVLL